MIRLLLVLSLSWPLTLLASESDDVISLFDGKSLGSWERVVFGGEGAVYVEDGELRLDQGDPLTAVVWKGPLPARTHYEISLQAKKINGDDFFLALTFPVNDSHCSFILGGWGGGLVGISSLNGMDAAENETGTVAYFETGTWYDVRVQVRPTWITCWIDDQEVVDLDIEGVEIGMRPGDIELCVPLGLATYQTWAAYRDLQWKPLSKD